MYRILYLFGIAFSICTADLGERDLRPRYTYDDSLVTQDLALKYGLGAREVEDILQGYVGTLQRLASEKIHGASSTKRCTVKGDRHTFTVKLNKQTQDMNEVYSYFDTHMGSYTREVSKRTLTFKAKIMASDDDRADEFESIKDYCAEAVMNERQEDTSRALEKRNEKCTITKGERHNFIVKHATDREKESIREMANGKLGQKSYTMVEAPDHFTFTAKSVYVHVAFTITGPVPALLYRFKTELQCIVEA